MPLSPRSVVLEQRLARFSYRLSVLGWDQRARGLCAVVPAHTEDVTDKTHAGEPDTITGRRIALDLQLVLTNFKTAH